MNTWISKTFYWFSWTGSPCTDQVQIVRALKLYTQILDIMTTTFVKIHTLMLHHSSLTENEFDKPITFTLTNMVKISGTFVHNSLRNYWNNSNLQYLVRMGHIIRQNYKSRFQDSKSEWSEWLDILFNYFFYIHIIYENMNAILHFSFNIQFSICNVFSLSSRNHFR